MAILQFNLHEGLATIQLARACNIAPALREAIEDYRAEGLTDPEIVQIIARVIDLIDEERTAEKGVQQ